MLSSLASFAGIVGGVVLINYSHKLYRRGNKNKKKLLKNIISADNLDKCKDRTAPFIVKYEVSNNMELINFIDDERYGEPAIKKPYRPTGGGFFVHPTFFSSTGNVFTTAHNVAKTRHTTSYIYFVLDETTDITSRFGYTSNEIRRKYKVRTFVPGQALYFYGKLLKETKKKDKSIPATTNIYTYSHVGNDPKLLVDNIYHHFNHKIDSVLFSVGFVTLLFSAACLFGIDTSLTLSRLGSRE